MGEREAKCTSEGFITALKYHQTKLQGGEAVACNWRSSFHSRESSIVLICLDFTIIKVDSEAMYEMMESSGTCVPQT